MPPARSMLWRRNELPRRTANQSLEVSDKLYGYIVTQPPMKTLYLDIFSGISGDMLIGALLDLGVEADRLEQELEKLGLEGYHLHVTRGHKASIEGVKFDVHLADGPSHQPAHGDGTAHTGQHQDSHQRQKENYGPHGGPLVGAS